MKCEVLAACTPGCRTIDLQTPYEASTNTPTRMTAVEAANRTTVIHPSISW